MIEYAALILALVAILYSASQSRPQGPPQGPIVVVPMRPKEEPPATRVYLDKNAGSVPETYAQVGYLTGGGADLVPLYGKRSESRKGRWFYYAIVKDTKVPVFVEGRDCMREVACDEIYDGSSVVVPDIDPGMSWKVKVYGNERRI
jgi:hypothetical protein